MRSLPGKLDIRSDSEYVVRQAEALLAGAGAKPKADNLDLWAMLEAELRQRPPGSITFTWVKGHATMADIQRGRSSWQDLCGNDGADKLASAAAAVHSAPHALTAAAQHRRRLATATHSAAVKILDARKSALANLQHVVLWLPSEPD